ncbi:MAG: class I mannose-6-phosphate isomerase [Christensenellaceae bacterium]|jgi:mannose-6-phosphate isomerase|nr:class I mannose-6-phosphate isomerase [Christensenellaceae bacterium]
MLHAEKLTPSLKEYIWGGDKLKTEWNKKPPESFVKVAESFELSCVPLSESFIAEGENKGKFLSQYIKENDGVLGGNCKRFPFFPLLIKLIDACDDLSVQVHPSDGFALMHEGQFGKTEAWYIADCNEGASIFLGFNKKVSKDEVKTAAENGTICGLLNRIPVKKGDFFFVPAGTVHALLSGVTVYEVQENSTITYRLYDYKRVDKSGKERELHLDKALQVINTEKFTGTVAAEKTSELINCNYFRLRRHFFSNNRESISFDTKGFSSFLSLTFLAGEAELLSNGYVSKAQKGDTYFVPYGAQVTITATQTDTEVLVACV